MRKLTQRQRDGGLVATEAAVAWLLWRAADGPFTTAWAILFGVMAMWDFYHHCVRDD